MPLGADLSHCLHEETLWVTPHTCLAGLLGSVLSPDLGTAPTSLDGPDSSCCPASLPGLRCTLTAVLPPRRPERGARVVARSQFLQSLLHLLHSQAHRAREWQRLSQQRTALTAVQQITHNDSGFLI
jgi:hypothetical protein